MLAKAINSGRSFREKSKVFLVDDHPIVRQGLAALINAEPDLEVCGEASGAEEAIAKVGTTNAQLFIADISLKDGNGIDLIKDIKSRRPDLKILVASMHDEKLFAERVLRAGAIGYINKAQPPAEIINNIRKALQGKICVSDAVNSRLERPRGAMTPNTPESPLEKLSNRELTIFELIGKGIATREIAQKLFLSIKTVETHREHIKTKLNLANASELVHHAMCWQLERTGMDEKSPVEQPE